MIFNLTELYLKIKVNFSRKTLIFFSYIKCTKKNEKYSIYACHRFKFKPKFCASLNSI